MFGNMLLSDESGNINFVDDRESIQFLIVFLELKDRPRTNLFEKNILLDSLVVVCFESKFSVVMTTGCSFAIASVEWKGGQAGLERDGGGARGLAHWGHRVI
jgi:hypothetical protein